MHLAATDGYKEIVEILLRAGADKNQPTKFGNTPLHLAAPDGHKEVVEIFFMLALIKIAKTIGLDSFAWAAMMVIKK